ncbi:unnamed protein product [Ambrosiozyma monospora]|uniref:Unnamed protein product n=1 Tax=Ambrosiozyma monospora TaxID=43982 RepID=A0ACB5SUF0_AMBMO|nr:unnamed protein product [Ambrosiozyma monospora]
MSLKQHLMKLRLQLDEFHADLQDFQTLQSTTLNQSMIQQLNRIKNTLIFIDNELSDDESSSQNVKSVQKLIDSLNSDLQSLSDDNFPANLTVSNYIFESNSIKIINERANKTDFIRKPTASNQFSAPGRTVKKAKSVRFRDNLVDYSPTSSSVSNEGGRYQDTPDEIEQSASENTSNAALFQKPYSDEEPTGQPTKQNVDSISNKQIFIKNQQQVLEQDEQINILGRSVSTQRSMALSINDELADQMVLLDDLENGVTSSNTRLVRTHNRLTKFREQVRKNSDWYTILVLVIILLLLLVILK